MTAPPVTALRTLLDLAELTVSGTPAGDGSKGRVRARPGVERQQTLPKEVVEQWRRPWLRGGWDFFHVWRPCFFPPVLLSEIYGRPQRDGRRRNGEGSPER